MEIETATEIFIPSGVRIKKAPLHVKRFCPYRSKNSLTCGTDLHIVRPHKGKTRQLAWLNASYEDMELNT